MVDCSTICLIGASCGSFKSAAIMNKIVNAYKNAAIIPSSLFTPLRIGRLVIAQSTLYRMRSKSFISINEQIIPRIFDVDGVRARMLEIKLETGVTAKNIRIIVATNEKNL